jgi:hypothetical protein
VLGTRIGGRSQGAEVAGTEADLTTQSPIDKMELGKTAEMGCQGLPKAKPLQEAAAGMGEGIGPLDLQKALPGKGIKELNAPTGRRQSQGGQGTSRSSAIHPG